MGSFIEICSEGSSKAALAACSCSLRGWEGCHGAPGWRNPDGFEGVRELSELIHPGQYTLVTKFTKKSAI